MVRLIGAKMTPTHRTPPDGMFHERNVRKCPKEMTYSVWDPDISELGRPRVMVRYALECAGMALAGLVLRRAGASHLRTSHGHKIATVGSYLCGLDAVRAGGTLCYGAATYVPYMDPKGWLRPNVR